MRKKFAMRKRRELLRRGAKIIHESFISEPGWRRENCGYSVEFQYEGWICVCSADDMLEAYKDALWMIEEVD